MDWNSVRPSGPPLTPVRPSDPNARPQAGPAVYMTLFARLAAAIVAGQGQQRR